jgi:hypothetical protein
MKMIWVDVDVALSAATAALIYIILVASFSQLRGSFVRTVE